MKEIAINDKKTINAWAFFDWANSAYALVISTAVFPIFFIAYTPDKVDILGASISNESLYSYAVAFSYLLIALLSPLLSGIADYTGRKLFFMKLFTIIGSLACIALFWFNDPQLLWLGTSGFILATIGFAGGLVFYNAFLPLIATEENFDKISAKGYAYGYIGSVILLLFILWMQLSPGTFGITDESLPARIGFLLVGVWWLGFAQYTFKHLPKDNKTHFNFSTIAKGYKEIKEVFNKVKQETSIKRFLLAFFLYSAGVQTVIYLATIFAQDVLGMETQELITTVLLIQLVGIIGAYLFANISNRRGNKFALSIQLVIWIGICLMAYFTTSKMHFYIIAGLVGLVMGGIQSLSRSSYSKFIEDRPDEVTSYFSFYDVLYKISIVAGTAIFGIVQDITGNMRYSVLALSSFFILGYLVLTTVDFKSYQNDLSK
ncbi:MAG TPA: MFS transporter [Saprospiraceae bacterium]|nr:MFS transporter [Saprospiraceae bacterium]HPK09019.1 MFS transporter [Saprospiraceae bacterium]HRX28565.1 MFS transporter [Saprospiraceae bacterium]